MRAPSNPLFPLLLVACGVSLAWRFGTPAEPPREAGRTPEVQLAADARSWLDDSLAATLRRREHKLDALPAVDPNDLDAIWDEAKRMAEIEQLRAAHEDLARGLYRIGPDPTPRRPGMPLELQVPGEAGALDITLELAFDDHPRLRDACAYRDATYEALLAERAAAFNALDQTEREAVRDRLAAINRLASPGSEDRDFLARFVPRGLLMLRESARLVRATELQASLRLEPTAIPK